jgi:flagellar hook protein FlgE
MLGSLNAGVSGLQQFQKKLDVIGNNIANSNTLAFKSARAEFEDAFSQTLTGGGVSSMQVGSGVSTASIHSKFQQGTTSSTGVAENLAVNGDGFFEVKDPVSLKTFVTRAGDFTIDNAGYLITNDGYRVQGFSDAGLTARGDLRIDDTGKPPADAGTYKSFNVDEKGRINVILTSGNSFVRGQVLLQRFVDPNALNKAGGNLFSGMEAAGALAQAEAPDTNGLGMIKGGHLEMSNVDLANEFATLITTQRGFQASARIITTSDEILQEVVNLKR